MKIVRDWLKKIKSALFASKKRAAVVIVLIAAAIFFARSYFLSQQPEDLESVAVERGELIKTIEVSGQVEAYEVADLHFQAGGKLVWLGVKEGDQVSKWQALASLDRRTLEANLKKDLIAFEKEFRDYDQSIDDNPLINHRFKRILEKAQYDLNSTVIDVEIRNLSLELVSLVSPIQGVVTNIDTPVSGVNVLATDAITVVNPETVYFEVEIDESDIASIQVGQQATIVLDAYIDEDIESEVTAIDFESSVSGGGGTVFLVKLKLPLNQNLKYKLGMSGDAEIVLSKEADVLKIPYDTIIEREGKNYVDVLTEAGQVERREIEIGLTSDDYAQVLNGLSQEDTVVFPQ